MVSVLGQGIQIVSHGAIEKSRILRNNPKMWPQIMKSNCRDVNAIYYNLSSCWFYQPKQGTNESSLPTASSSNDANFMSSFKCAVDPTKNKGCVGSIPNLLWHNFYEYMYWFWLVLASIYAKTTCKSWMSTLPTAGQLGGGRLPSITSGASLGICMYWFSLSTEMM